MYAKIVSNNRDELVQHVNRLGLQTVIGGNPALGVVLDTTKLVEPPKSTVRKS